MEKASVPKKPENPKLQETSTQVEQTGGQGQGKTNSGQSPEGEKSQSE